MNDKMKLEEAIKTLKIIANKSDQPFKFAIETVLQALEEVTEERNDYRSQINSAFNNGFIPKKKIEDKLKQLNSEIQYCARQNGKTIKLGKIMGLQELLEDK